MRYALLNFVLGFIFLKAVFAQPKYELMDWKTQFTLRTYLIEEMHGQYDLRRTNLKKALSSPTDLKTYQEHCKKQYLDILGGFPEKTEPNPQITKTINLEKYRIENIIFESGPNHHVVANLYIPKTDGPFPAVLIPCGHEMTSKTTVSYQKTAALFALNGFAAMVVDPISQGGRVQFLDEEGKRILRGSTTEHTLLNAGANLVGTNVVTYELTDNVRCLDYLESRPEIDAERFGCIGNSGGGAQTACLAAYDDRIKVAAICSNFASREKNYELDGTADGCQQIPYEGKQLLELADFLIVFAPKPVMILAGRYDFFNYTGTKNAFNELKSAYTVLSAPEKASMFTYDDGHGISKPKREAAVQWFSRWFLNNNSPVAENGLQVLTGDELNCTNTGQVGTRFEDEISVQQLNLLKADELAGNRQDFKEVSSLDEYKMVIKELLAVDEKPVHVNEEFIGADEYAGYTLQKFILRKENISKMNRRYLIKYIN